MQQGYSGYPSQSVFNPGRRTTDERYVWMVPNKESSYYRVVKRTSYAPAQSYSDIIVGQSLDPVAAVAIWRLCITSV